MTHWTLRHHWAVIAALILGVVLFAVVGTTAAQPPVPHAVLPGDDCLSCHEAGVAGALRLARDHAGRTNDDCAFCHQASEAFADDIPHTVEGRDDCLSCHSGGIGTIIARSHLDRTNDMCRLCHLPSPAAAEPTPPPPPSTTPGPDHPAGNGCASCHQRVFADEGHTLFNDQVMGDSEAGAALFAESCVPCHGEDGTTSVGEEGTIINAEAYWSTHDDADILRGIGIGTHGGFGAFSQDYGGSLSWEEILNLAAYVRTWGQFPSSYPGMPPTGVAYTTDIGPLLTEKCGGCHGSAAGLSVTDYASLMAGADSGPVITAGDPDGSQIVTVLQTGHFAQLSEAEMERLIGWIANGASE